MTRHAIMCDAVVSPRPPISHAVKAGGLVFVSATPPWTDGYALAKGDFATQMRQSMDNLIAILEAAGTSLAKAVKMTIIVTRIQDAPEMNAIYEEYIKRYFPKGDYPARTSFEARMGIKDFLVEIECVAEA